MHLQTLSKFLRLNLCHFHAQWNQRVKVQLQHRELFQYYWHTIYKVRQFQSHPRKWFYICSSTTTSLNQFRPSKQFEGRCGVLFSLGLFFWCVYYSMHKASIESKSMIASRNTWVSLLKKLRKIQFIFVLIILPPRVTGEFHVSKSIYLVPSNTLRAWYQMSDSHMSIETWFLHKSI